MNARQRRSGERMIERKRSIQYWPSRHRFSVARRRKGRREMSDALVFEDRWFVVEKLRDLQRVRIRQKNKDREQQAPGDGIRERTRSLLGKAVVRFLESGAVLGHRS